MKANKASNLEPENVNLNAESLTKLFHKALEKLKINNDQTFTGVITLLELIVDDKFPLNNICFWLFLDVVNWFSLENSCTMSYSPDIKLFWCTAEQLFHGKFQRFMTGLKHSGQHKEGILLNPQNSQLNFAVASRKYLMSKDFVYKDEIQPCIIHSLLSLVAKHGQWKSHKLCIDGKKINASTEHEMGQIELRLTDTMTNSTHNDICVQDDGSHIE